MKLKQGVVKKEIQRVLTHLMTGAALMLILPLGVMFAGEFHQKTGFLFFLGVLAFVIQITVSYFVLNNQVSRILRVENHQLRVLVDHRTRELEEQKAINLETSKFSALGKMAGSVAHEINTPLTTIHLLTKMLWDEIHLDVPDLEKMAEHLRNIENTTDRVAKTVRGLKSFGRDTSKDPFENHQLRNLVEDSVALCADCLKSRGISLRIHMNSNLFIECRAIQITQVFVNLISNACDALDSIPHKWIEIQAKESRNGLEIRVIDSGFGIPDSVRESLFKPFFTTKPPGRGSGMGLSISLGLIQSHDGELLLDTTSPHTCFVIRLPRQQRRLTQKTPISA